MLLLRPMGLDQILELSVPANPAELVRVRRLVTAWLRRLGAGDDDIDDLIIASNEIASNAIEHAYGPSDEEFEVTVTVRGTVVEIQVTDHGRWSERTGGPNRGRGLNVTRELTDALEIEPTPLGTVVRFRKQLGRRR